MSSPGSADDRVLLEPELDRRLLRDGFVVFPLFRPEQVEPLREEFGRLRGWEGDGFHSDLVVPDAEYRRATSKVIGVALDDAVTNLFDGYQPFLRNFLCKYPGADSDLYIHRDWMYVDERLGERTYVAWVALEDIRGHNGQLRVLRGSQDLDPMLRGTDLIAPWLAHTDVIDARLLGIPVRAGDCVVFDNRLVHASFPNNSDRPRVVAAVGMRPAGVPLVHFRRSGPDTAARYDVDEDFFCTHTPQDLMAAPPDLPVAEEVAVTSLDLTIDELAEQLDIGILAHADRARNTAVRLRQSLGERWREQRSELRQRWDAELARRAGRDPETRGPFSKVVDRVSALLTPGAAGTDRATSQDADLPFRERLRAQLDDLPTKAAIAVLGLNEAVVSRFGPATPAVWDPAEFDWTERVAAGWADIRAEVDALLSGPTEIPHIEDVTGGIPQGNEGPWRSFVLMHQGRWMDWNCERCPRTTELMRTIPGLTMAGFSVLEPGTHITEHRGPNKGALRYQLGVIVPGAFGDCRIRVGDEMLVWQEGEGVMFDFTFPHEAWNDSDGIRVLLMLEVITPLPWYLDRTNRMAQRAMGWFPTTRDMTARLRRLEPSLRRHHADS